ncbi:hypothetical protein CARUB_v10015318mg [Capsella rubella]|uniref:Uncharacterized protein n=1 Tax=Capsella rubella TaxID=81985 RepID=R0G8W6_9BRAS|nr:uncharacterized protein LOC17892050 [Capsella rubella]EOA32072.1 hypothetical protein CARUB_v10015318mg [Capsella rubella]
MEKTPMKIAFIAFLAITFVMCSIVNVEAKRVLSEETPQVDALHHNEALQQVEKRQVLQPLGCNKGCELICVPSPIVPLCRCIC